MAAQPPEVYAELLTDADPSRYRLRIGKPLKNLREFYEREFDSTWVVMPMTAADLERGGLDVFR